jgi:excisionase family DNA binding protein
MAAERLYNPTEIAEYLQVHRETVMEHLRSGKLRGRKVGRLWRISESDLQTFIDAYINQPDTITMEGLPPITIEEED